jgi:hypothetical protein
MDWLTAAWNSYWSRAELLVAVAAGITLLAGFIAWISGVFRPNKGDAGAAESPKAAFVKDAIPKDSWALDSQEPEDFGAK